MAASQKKKTIESSTEDDDSISRYHFPDLVVENVLSFLPPNVLHELNSNSKSKFLYNLIPGFYFHNLCTSNGGKTQQKLIIFGAIDSEKFYEFTVDAFDNEQDVGGVARVQQLELHPCIFINYNFIGSLYEDVSFLGSSRGLVCLQMNGSWFIIWNPTTCQAILIRPPKKTGFFKKICGFGYNALSGSFEICLVGFDRGRRSVLRSLVYDTTAKLWIAGPELDYGSGRGLKVVGNGGVVLDCLVWSDGPWMTGFSSRMTGFSFEDHCFFEISYPKKGYWKYFVGADALWASTEEWGEKDSEVNEWDDNESDENVWDENGICTQQFWRLTDLKNGSWERMFDFTLNGCLTGQSLKAVLGISRDCQRILILTSDETLLVIARDGQFASVKKEGGGPMDVEDGNVRAVPYVKTTLWPFQYPLGVAPNHK